MTRSTALTAALAIAAVLAAVALSASSLSRRAGGERGRVGMAVEFMDHAAAAYVAQDRGWYEAHGLHLSSYTSYATGMALASAMARREIQVAYVCLVPAINAYANAGVPIRIVAGTHRYGYALVAKPGVVDRIEDLARDDARVGCVREGGAVDVLMHRALDRFHLDRERILGKVRRMSPPRLLLALVSGQLDAAFLPEQWASMAEDHGFAMLLTAQDIWPGLPGSVLVVKEELLREEPELVRALVEVNERATRWINAHPEEAADTLTRALSLAGSATPPPGDAVLASGLGWSREMMQRSMGRLEYITAISSAEVQEVIEYATRLGYLEQPFAAEELLDTRFLR